MTVKQALERVRAGLASCIVLRAQETETEVLGRGIAPLLQLYDRGVLRDAIVVDKIVGRAAAMLMVDAGVSACHALTMSRGAWDCFFAAGIPAQYEQLTEGIINRNGDGPCPMEYAVQSVENPAQAVTVIRETLRSLRAERSEDS